MNDLQEIIKRIQTPHLEQVLRDFPVAILHGARQTGKTTLTQVPQIGRDRSYLTLDDFDILDLARRDPAALFMGRERITLDEVQRQPDILMAIKSSVDRHRAPGRFLLTGSANLLLMKQAAESLAGRAVYVNLPPLTWAEIERRDFGATIDLLLEKETADEILECISDELVTPTRKLSAAVFAGGYPLPALAREASFRTRWFDGYVQTYLERDLRDLSSTDNLVEFRRFMRICAAQNGRLLNIGILFIKRGPGLV